MIYNTPIEAYLICYGPLFITVLGFILFAFVTDGDARRTYLRRLSGRKTGPVTKAIHGRTPAGVYVTIIPDDRVVLGEAATAPPTPTPTEVVNETAVVVDATEPDVVPAEPESTEAEASTDEPDDLTRIEGIGPKMSQALIAAGLDTFEKVAVASLEDIRSAIEAADMNFAPSAESWAEQADFAAKGDWDGLSALQDKLVSGRYPTSDDS